MLPIPWAAHAQRLASDLRRAPSALYHLFLLPAIPFSRLGSSTRSIPGILEQTRERYPFLVVGYVVMLEHAHLLISEPEMASPSTVMQVLNQRTAWALLSENKQNMTQMGHSHTLAIFGKMMLMKNLFPGACDEQIECW